MFSVAVLILLGTVFQSERSRLLLCFKMQHSWDKELQYRLLHFSNNMLHSNLARPTYLPFESGWWNRALFKSFELLLMACLHQ
jgi:hypothetical protein